MTDLTGIASVDPAHAVIGKAIGIRVLQHFEIPFLRWLDKPPRHPGQLDTIYLHEELILRIADSV